MTQDVLDAVDALAQTIGHEYRDERGRMAGTGLFALVHAIDARVANIETDRAREALIFKSRAAGALAVIGAVFALFIWLAGDRVENVQKLVRTPAAAETKK